jgi:hypothetical protein
VSRTDYLGRQVSVTLARTDELGIRWANEDQGLVVEQDEQGLTLENDAGETAFHSWLDVESISIAVD